jgi:hypothetical protein
MIGRHLWLNRRPESGLGRGLYVRLRCIPSRSSFMRQQAECGEVGDVHPLLSFAIRQVSDDDS